MKTVRVLLIGFSPVVKAGLQTILAKDGDIELIGDAADGKETLLQLNRASAQGRPVDVVLTETWTSTFDGVQAMRLIKEEFPEVAILALTERDNDSRVIDAIQAGAGGYIFIKDMSPEVLLQSVRRVTEGGMQMKTALLRTVVDDLLQNARKTLAERTTEAAHLTPREVDVLRLMGNGASNKVITETLCISLYTTKKHVQNVVNKLQAGSRTRASIFAAQAGIVGNPIAPGNGESAEES